MNLMKKIGLILLTFNSKLDVHEKVNKLIISLSLLLLVLQEKMAIFN